MQKVRSIMILGMLHTDNKAKSHRTVNSILPEFVGPGSAHGPVSSPLSSLAENC
jgi:hypothetical protein